MRRFARENGLSLFFATIFLATLAGQSFAGEHNFNAEQAAHGEQTLSWWQYVLSPSFGGAVMENWQSEFLQFSLFIAATIWLVQKGSNESKALGDAGVESDEQQQIGRMPAVGARWAKARRHPYADLRELAADRDDAHLLRDLVRPIPQQLARLQRTSRRRTTERPSPGAATSSTPTSGRRPSRTGSPNSSPSARWWSLRSTFASADLPNPSPSARRTTRQQRRARSVSHSYATLAALSGENAEEKERTGCGWPLFSAPWPEAAETSKARPHPFTLSVLATLPP